jgi:FolB domain-containing protein
MTTDLLRIRDLRVRCRVGVTAAERRKPQELTITVTLYADLAEACRSDRLSDTVDYAGIKRRVLVELERQPFRLIERVAQRVADLAMRDARVVGVRVLVQKPGALRFAMGSEVEIERWRRQPKTGKGQGTRR